MIKKIFLVVLCFLMITSNFIITYADNTTYYVDSEYGDDSNNGTSESSPWKTLYNISEKKYPIDKDNNYTGKIFYPGDKILLKSGSVWNDMYLSLRGSGTAENPIIVDMYGGDVKPIINTNGKYSQAVSLLYNKYWEINNLEITNKSVAAGQYRRGVYAFSGDSVGIKHMYFKNLYVHDVNGILSDRANGGIILQAKSDSKAVNYEDILIENCVVRNVDRDAIRISNEKIKGSNIRIRNNFVDNIGGDGIVTVGTQSAIIEYNVAKDCNYRSGTACVAIWTYNSDNTIIQNNEAYLTHNTQDGQGFDSDYNCTGSVFQYNYSHDNTGGFMLICNNPNGEGTYNTGTIVRYNISQNDKTRGIMLSGNPKDSHIYNNTIYIKSSLNTNIVDSWKWPKSDGTGGGWANNTRFTNNIIYNLGSGGYNLGLTTNNTFENNLFYGNHPSSEPFDPYKIVSDPEFYNVGNADIGIETGSAYKIKYNSPCIDKGVIIANNCGYDYFKNPIDSLPDIGACEYQKMSISNVSINGNNATVTIENFDSMQSNNIIMCIYDSDNRILDIKIKLLVSSNILFAFDDIKSNYKVFVINNFENLKPICQAWN